MQIADTLDQFKQAAELQLRSVKMLGEAALDDPAHLATACYLGGYVVEMLLKAAILKDDPTKAPLSKFPKLEPVRCKCAEKGLLECPVCKASRLTITYPYRTHDIKALIRELESSQRFSATVSNYKGRFAGWKAEVRYATGPWIPNTGVAKQFLKTVSDFSDDMRMGGLGV